MMASVNVSGIRIKAGTKQIFTATNGQHININGRNNDETDSSSSDEEGCDMFWVEAIKRNAERERRREQKRAQRTRFPESIPEHTVKTDGNKIASDEASINLTYDPSDTTIHVRNNDLGNQGKINVNGGVNTATSVSNNNVYGKINVETSSTNSLLQNQLTALQGGFDEDVRLNNKMIEPPSYDDDDYKDSNLLMIWPEKNKQIVHRAKRHNKVVEAISVVNDNNVATKGEIKIQTGTHSLNVVEDNDVKTDGLIHVSANGGGINKVSGNVVKSGGLIHSSSNGKAISNVSNCTVGTGAKIVTMAVNTQSSLETSQKSANASQADMRKLIADMFGSKN